jgi:hypothetical protein
MTERGGGEPDDFWTLDEGLGEVQLYRDTWTLRLNAHLDESSYRRSSRTEIVPLTASQGRRTDVLAKPYILVPDITLTAQLYPAPDVAGAIGGVKSSDWEGMKHEEVGAPCSHCFAWTRHPSQTEHDR